MLHFISSTRFPLYITLGAACLTVLFVLSGLEKRIILALNDPHNATAWWWRNHGIKPGMYASIAALVFLLIWPLRLRWQHVRRTAAVWLATLIVASGLIGSVLAPELTNRPRPRETVLLQGTEQYTPPFFVSAADKGKSFVSGHASIAFIFAVPFFTLLSILPRLAWGFLLLGLGYGFFLGYMRMVLGAHFLTDILWSGTLVLLGGWFFSRVITLQTDIPNRYTVPLLLFVLGCIVWFNKLNEHLDIALPATATTLDVRGLPCTHFRIASDTPTAHVSVHLTAYGAPASNLRLVHHQEGSVHKITFERTGLGLYRKISCMAEIAPAELELLLPR